MCSVIEPAHLLSNKRFGRGLVRDGLDLGLAQEDAVVSGTREVLAVIHSAVVLRGVV